jgi:hypothetical protein
MNSTGKPWEAPSMADASWEAAIWLAFSTYGSDMHGISISFKIYI